MNSKDKDVNKTPFGETEFGQMEDKLSDVSLYGEFISTFHSWVSSEEQKNKAQYLQNLGRNNK
jgi:hypothetical protein